MPTEPKKPNIDLTPYKYTPELKSPEQPNPLSDLPSSHQYGEAADFGNSKYDETTVSPLDLQTGDYIYERGEKQSGLSKLGLGVLRAVEKAGIEGAKTPGYLYALGEWGARNAVGEDFTLDKALDNQYLNALEKADEYTKEKLLPVYQSYKAAKGSFLEQVFTASFFAREGADGLGYLAGMMLPGYALKSIGMAAKLSKAGLDVSKLGKIGLTGANVELGTQTLINTSVEALAEAKGAIESLDYKFKDILDENSPNYNPINPKTGEIWTEYEIAEAKANAARGVFVDNMGILMLPNLIMNKALLGGGKKGSHLLDDFRDASGKLVAEPVKKSAFKEFGKAAGTGIVSEGFIEEGGQSAIENYETKKALHQTDKDFALGIAESYLDMLGTTEGKKSILLGALIGGIANVAGKYRENKFAKTQYPTISKLINDNPQLFNDDVEVYQKDEQGNIIFDENNKPIVDDTKVIQNIKSLIDLAKNAKEAEEAALNNDQTAYDYANHNIFTKSIIPYIEYGDIGMEILNEKLDGIKETKESMNESKLAESKQLNFDNIQYINGLKQKAKQLQRVYSETREIIEGLNLESIKFPEEYKSEIEDYKNVLTNAVFQENANQLFLKDKIKDLQKEVIHHEMNYTPQDKIFANRYKLEIEGLNNLLEESYAKYEALKNPEEQQKALKNFVEDNQKEAEILKEQQEKASKEEAQKKETEPEDIKHKQAMYNALISDNLEAFQPLYDELLKSPTLSVTERKQLETKLKSFTETNTETVTFNVGDLENIDDNGEIIDDTETIQTDVSSFLNTNTVASINEEQQSDVTPDSYNNIELVGSEKHINARNNVVMMRLFDHYIVKDGDKKYFSFKRNEQGFPNYHNTSNINIEELNKVKENDSVELRLVEFDDVEGYYKNTPDFDGYHIGIYSNDNLIGFVQQTHPIDPESKNYDESKALREELINYRKTVVKKLQNGETVTEQIVSRGNGNLYTKLKDNRHIDAISNVLYDARDKDKIGNKVVFAYVNKTQAGSLYLDLKQGDLTNNEYSALKKYLATYSDKLKLKAGQPFQMVKAPDNTWSVIPVYANKIDNFTAGLILDIINQTENNTDLLALSKKLDDFIFTSIKNDRANLVLSNLNNKLTFKVNTNVYTLNDIKTNKKVKDDFINDLKTSRQNINVTNINTLQYQELLKTRNTLVTNVVTYEGEYFVQPYLEFSFNAAAETKKKPTVKVENISFEAPQQNTDNKQPEDIQAIIDAALKANNIVDLETNDEALSKTKDETKLDIQAFNRWLAKNLPQLSIGDKSNLAQLKTNLVDTYGMFKDMTIYLFEGAGSKTAFHEAFHGVFRNFLSLDDKHAIIEEAKAKYPKPTEEELKSLQEGLSKQYTNEQLTYLYYEEKLADEFGEFTYNYNNKTFLQKLGRAISDFFDKLLSLFNIFTLNNQSAIDRVFKEVNKGKYSNKSKKVDGVSIFNRALNIFNNEYAYSKELRDKFNPATEQRIIQSIGNKFIEIYQRKLNNNEKNIGKTDIYNEIFEKFATFLKDATDNPTKYNVTDIKNAAIVLSPNTVPLIKNQVNKYLRSANINVKDDIITESEGLSETELGDEEIVAQDGYIDKGYGDATSVSGMTSASKRLKMFLSSIPIMNDDNTVKKDVFGIEQYYDFTKTYYYIEYNLTGIYNLNDQMLELHKLSESRPEIKTVMSRLGYEVIKDPNNEFNFIVNEIAVPNITKESLELLRNDFKTNFSKQQLSYTLVKFKQDKKLNTFSYEIIDSNRQTIELELKDQWSNNLIDPARKNISELLEDGTNSPFGTKKAIDLYNKWLSVKDGKLTVKELKSILEKVGIEFSDITLKKMVNDDIFYKTYVDQYIQSFTNTDSNVFKTQREMALKELIEIESKSVVNNYTSSFNDVENKNIYSIQLPSFISKNVAVINSEGSDKFTTWLNEYQKDSYYKYSNLLNDFKDNNFRTNQFSVSFLDGLKKSKGESKGSKFTGMSPRDFFTMQFALFQNKAISKAQKGTTLFKHMYITPSDKSMGAIFNMKKYDVGLEVDLQSKTSEINFTNSEITKAFYNVFLGEATRIKNAMVFRDKLSRGEVKLSQALEHYHYASAVKEDIDEYTNKENTIGLTQEEYQDAALLLNGQAFQINNFTNTFSNQYTKKLVDMLNLTDVSLIESTLEVNLKDDILKSINEELKKEFTNTIKEMRKKGLIKVKNNLYESVTLDVSKENEHLNIMQLAADFSANTLLANIELSKLFNGDPAQYKPGDLQKRTYQSQSMITNNRFGQKTIKTLVIKDVKLESESIASLTKDEEIIKEYKKTNVTDAQVYITPELYKAIHISRGTWGPEMQKAYDIAEGKQVGKIDESLRMLLGGIKPFYFGNRFDESLGIQRYEQVKCAMIPMFKSYLDINPLLAEKFAEMKDSGAEMLAHESSFKAAIGYRGAITDNNKNTIELNTDNFGIQVDNPIHGMDEKNDSMRQLKMLLAGSIDISKTYNGISGKAIRDTILDMEATNIYESLHELQFKLNTSINSNFSKFISDAITKRNVTDNVEEMLDILKGEFKYALDSGTLSTQLENLISSIYTNNAIKQSFAGDARVQATSLGLKFKNLAEQQENLSNEAKLLQQELKWIRPTKDGSKLEYAECAMPAWSKHFFDENGLLKDINNIPDELRNIIAYRIPTEGLHSMLPIKVVKFLPETMGNFILLPYEVTTQMGADFDFDKIYFINKEMYSDINNDGTVTLKAYNYIDGTDEKSTDTRYARYLRYTSDNDLEQMSREDFNNLSVKFQNVRAARNNKIIDSYLTLLTSNENINLLIKPSGFEKMKAIKKQYFDLYEKNNFFSSRTQRDYKSRNHTGIALKGQSALHVSGHSYAVMTNLRLKAKSQVSSIMFNGESKALFTELYTEDGTLIADELSSIMAAILDDIKDPILEKLGINKHTIDVLATIIRSGYNMETALRFISQPAVKELSALLDNNSAKIKQPNQGWNSVKSLIAEYEEKLFKLNELESISESVSRNIEASKSPISDITDTEMDNILSNYKIDDNSIKVKHVNEKGNVESTNATDEELANFYAMQIRVLKSFKNLQVIAGELTEVNKFFAINKEVGPNYEDIISKQELYDSILNSKVITGFNVENIPTLDATWKVHKDALEYFSKYFPYGSNYYMDIKRTLFGIQTNKPLNQTSTADRQYLNGFIRAFIDNNGGYFKEMSTQYDELFVSLPKTITSILTGDESTEFNKVTYKDIKNNYFMSNIKIEFDKKNPSKQYVKIRNGKLDLLVKNNMIEGFNALYRNSNTKQLAIDLVNHAFASSGFTNSAKSIAPYISPKILDDLGYMDYRKTMIKDLNENIFNYNNEFKFRLIDQAIRNNNNLTKVYDAGMFNIDENSPIPDIIYTTKEDVIRNNRADDFILDDETFATPEYIRLFDTSGEVWFRRSLMSDESLVAYEKTKPLGKKNYLLELNPFEDIEESYLTENNKIVKVDENINNNEGLNEEDIMDEWNIPTLEQNTQDIPQLPQSDNEVDTNENKDNNNTFEDDPNPCK